MRSRTVALILGLAVLSLSLVLLYGCSSDDSNPTGTNTGSNSNPEFLSVQEQIDCFIDSTLYFVAVGVAEALNSLGPAFLPHDHPGTQHNKTYWYDHTHQITKAKREKSGAAP